MLRELVICIIIILSILVLDVFTQNYTQKSISIVTEQLAELKNYVLEENKEVIQSSIDNIDNDWKRMYSKLAYYIEHDELEKVDTAIVLMKGYIETDDYSSAIAELDGGKFVLEHIQEKNSFSLKNIF